MSIEKVGSQEQTDQKKDHSATPGRTGESSTTSYQNAHRVFDLTTTPAGGNSTLIRSNRSGKSKILASGESSLLASCQTFDSLQAHAERYARQIKRGQLSAAKGIRNKLLRLLSHFIEQGGMELPVGEEEMKPFLLQLLEWANDGFLVSEMELLDEIMTLAGQAGPTETGPGTITAIGIPTCNRPETLQRCLTSYIENNRTYARTVEYFVSDDSADTKMREQNRGVIAKLEKEHKVQIRYIDRKHREQFAQLLSRRSGISPEVCRFAVLGDKHYRFSGGANRNTLLFRTMGQRSLQVDDDSVCRLVSASDTVRQEDKNHRLAFSSHSEPYEYWFYKDVEELYNTVSTADMDFLALHEQLLGQSVTGYIRSQQPAMDINGLTPELLSRLHRFNPGIGVTYVGCAGESGLRESGYLERLFMDEVSFRHLTEPAEDFPLKFTTRYLLRSVDRTTISNGISCMGLNMGMDQTRLLPPFMPSGRNEDAIFGQLLRAACPQLVTCYQPYALIHDPPNITNRDSSVSVQLQSPRLNDFIWWFIAIRMRTLINPEPVERFHALGTYLIEVGTLTDKEFYERMCSLVSQAYTRQIQQGEDLIANRSSAPTAWKDRMESYIGEVQKFLLRGDFFNAFDLNAPGEEVLPIYRTIVGRFGRLLTCWPELVEASKEIDSDEW